MKECENCGKELKCLSGIYNLNFGFVCFSCYEEIRKIFDSEQFPQCKDCEKELNTTIEVENGICSKCLINDIQLTFGRRDDSCFQLDY
jgi:hypothetical protein